MPPLAFSRQEASSSLSLCRTASASASSSRAPPPVKVKVDAVPGFDPGDYVQDADLEQVTAMIKDKGAGFAPDNYVDDVHLLCVIAMVQENTRRAADKVEEWRRELEAQRKRLPVRLGGSDRRGRFTAPPLSRARLSRDGNFSGDWPPHPPTLPDRRPPHPPRSSSRTSADLRGSRPGRSPYRYASLPRGILFVKGMSASENQAAETSKDTDDMKADRPWNIIHIRLPPRKSLSDASLILSKKVPRNTRKAGSKEVPEPITDKPGKNLITAPVQGEASNHSPRAGLCNKASSNIMSKTLSAESESDTSGDKLLELDEVNVSVLSKNLRVSAEEQGSDASSYAGKQGLCEEANNNNPSMILLLPVLEFPEDNNVSSPSKNHATTGMQGEVERNNSSRKKLFYNTDSKLADEEGNSPKWNITITTEQVFEGSNYPIPTKLSDEVKNNAPSSRPTDPANKSSPHKRLTSSVQATGTSQNIPGMNLSPSVCQAVEQSTNAAKMEVIKVYQEFEEKVKRNVYLDNLYHQDRKAKTNPDMTLSTNAIECEVFEHANYLIPTHKLSDVARNKAPSNRPTDPAKKSSPHKKPRTSALQATCTSQNTFGMKLSTSDGQTANQSKSAAALEAIKQYPGQTNNTGCKEAPKLINDNTGKNLTTAPEQGELSSQSPKVGLCDGVNRNTRSKTPSAESQSDVSGDKIPNEANDSTLIKNLRVAAEEQGSDASNYARLSEEANNNIPSMIILLPVQELPEDHIEKNPSKNLTTTGKQDNDEHNKSLRKKLLYDTDGKVDDKEGNCPSWKPRIAAVKYEKVFEEANHPIPCKKLSDEAKNNGPSNRPTDSANNKSVYKRRRTSSIQTTGISQNTPGMKLSASVSQAVEQSTNAANMDITKVYQEFEDKIKRTVYLDNLPDQATEAKTNPSGTLSKTAIECEVFEHANHTIPTKKSGTLSKTAIECEVFEHANHTIPTKKLSDVARNKAPNNTPTDPAKKSTPCKKPRTSAVQATVASQNTSTMGLPISHGRAVKQSKCAEDLEAVKQYQEFVEKVKRTVYLDNLSHQVTEAVIKAALSQFCTIRKVSFVVNYTIPYNIPHSALVEMETEKDAEVVVSMLHDFPFMMSGMPRPVRAIHATAKMFNDRPRRPGSKLKFRWMGHTDPDFKMVKKLKLLSRKHEVENLALIEHELEEEKLVAAKQQENLNVNYEMMETMDSVLLSGMSNYLSSIYNVNWNDVF
ncbi:hypothetical protein ACQ4PT_048109 [Festuca glaucescens]